MMGGASDGSGFPLVEAIVSALVGLAVGFVAGRSRRPASTPAPVPQPPTEDEGETIVPVGPRLANATRMLARDLEGPLPAPADGGDEAVARFALDVAKAAAKTARRDANHMLSNRVTLLGDAIATGDLDAAREHHARIVELVARLAP